MSRFALDTDILTLFQEGHAVVRQRVKAQSANDVSITVITVEEQLSGWYTFVRKAKQIDQLAIGYEALADNVRCLSGFGILSFDEPAIRRYESLRQFKLSVRRNDLRIVAIALERNVIVVTRNAGLQADPGIDLRRLVARSRVCLTSASA